MESGALALTNIGAVAHGAVAQMKSGATAHSIVRNQLHYTMSFQYWLEGEYMSSTIHQLIGYNND